MGAAAPEPFAQSHLAAGTVCPRPGVRSCSSRPRTFPPRPGGCRGWSVYSRGPRARRPESTGRQKRRRLRIPKFRSTFRKWTADEDALLDTMRDEVQDGTQQPAPTTETMRSARRAGKLAKPTCQIRLDIGVKAADLKKTESIPRMQTSAGSIDPALWSVSEPGLLLQDLPLQQTKIRLDPSGGFPRCKIRPP